MAEIKRKINEVYLGSINYPHNPCGFIIEEEHTIADIARWLIEHDWHGEVLMMISDPKFIEDAKDD